MKRKTTLMQSAAAAFVAVLIVSGVAGCTKAEDPPAAGRTRTRRERRQEASEHGPLTELIYYPGYSDMLGGFREERITRDENGKYVYRVTSRERHDTPTQTTVYAFDEDGLEILEEIIERHDITSFATRRESDVFATDYSPWSYTLIFDDSALGGSSHETVSFGQYRRYRDEDYEAMDELLETARSLRGEVIAETTDGEDDGALSQEGDLNLAAVRYDEVLTEIYRFIAAKDMEGLQAQYISTGLMEYVMYASEEEAWQTVGYAITDITGDFVPELLIGKMAAGTFDGTQCDLFACYSVKDGELITVFEGWQRSRMRWISEASFFYTGSGGAARSAVGTVSFEGDAPSDMLYAHDINAHWSEFYFTEENDANGISYYCNYTGEWDPAASKLLHDDGESFTQFYETHESMCRAFPLKPVASYLSEKAIREEQLHDYSPLVGHWYLLSYVNRTITGYYFHPDGTWTTEVNCYGILYLHEYSEEVPVTFLYGTWEVMYSGSDTQYFLMYAAEGNELYQIRLMPLGDDDPDPSDGFYEMKLEFSNGDVFYKSAQNNNPAGAFDSEAFYGEWTNADGAAILVYDDNGTLCYDYYPAPGYRMTYGELTLRTEDVKSATFDASNGRGGAPFVFEFVYDYEGFPVLMWEGEVFHRSYG